jgi:hypothetical protein
VHRVPVRDFEHATIFLYMAGKYLLSITERVLQSSVILLQRKNKHKRTQTQEHPNLILVVHVQV